MRVELTLKEAANCLSGDTAMTIGKNIKKLRAAKGWTREELARQANISLSAIKKAESANGNPTAQTLKKLIIALGAPSDAVLFDDDELDQELELRNIMIQAKGLDDEEKFVLAETAKAIIAQYKAKKVYNN